MDTGSFNERMGGGVNFKCVIINEIKYKVGSVTDGIGIY